MAIGQNSAGTTMFVVEGFELEQLIEHLKHGTSISTYKLRISVQDNSFTYKVNEGMWSAPIGSAQAPY